jgi:hypothetical protein
VSRCKELARICRRKEKECCEADIEARSSRFASEKIPLRISRELLLPPLPWLLLLTWFDFGGEKKGFGTTPSLLGPSEEVIPPAKPPPLSPASSLPMPPPDAQETFWRPSAAGPERLAYTLSSLEPAPEEKAAGVAGCVALLRWPLALFKNSHKDAIRGQFQKI